MRIGIIGCGAIGSEIARASVTSLENRIELVALYDIDKGKSKALSTSVKKNIVANSPDEVFDKADLVVESAAAGVSEGLLKKAIEKSKDILIMSVGGLIASAKLLEEARRKNVKVYLPSGAVCGIDGLKAAKASNIKKVTLTTRKPVKGLRGAAYLKEKKIDLDSIKGEKVVFEGSALEAVKGFPKNINVASLLSLAGLGADHTTVRIVTSPAYTKNTHEIEIISEAANITTKTENVPSENNPKTSKLAFLSAIATLKGAAESVRIGT